MNLISRDVEYLASKLICKFKITSYEALNIAYKAQQNALTKQQNEIRASDLVVWSNGIDTSALEKIAPILSDKLIG